MKPPTEAMEPYALERFDRAGKSALVHIHRLPFNIGRGAENDLVLSHSSVSRHHASLSRVGDGLGIIDQNSRNGVFVNEKRLPAMEARRLQDGDLVLIGRIRLKLVQAAAPEVPPILSEESPSTQFFSHRESWDPIQTLSGILPRQELSTVREKSSECWQRLLRNLLEAPLPQKYEPILDAVEETVAFDRCFVIIFENGSPERMKFLASRIQTHSPAKSGSAVFVSREILRRVAASREAVVLTRWDKNFEPTRSFILSGAGSALCVPLVARGAVVGVLYLDRLTSAQCFTQNDIEELGPIAGLVALKIENIQLLEAYFDSELARRDLEIAEEIQRSLLPRQSVSLSGYSLECYTRPCRQVGGDYLDFFERGGGGLLLALGDVSGKGLPSALYMVGVLSTLRSLPCGCSEIEALLATLEGYVRSTFRPDHFLTLLLGSLEAASGKFSYCNAGHLPPMVFTPGGEVRETQATDPALNVVPWRDFRRFECALGPGDLLILYTDGLIEQQSRQGEEFGRERLVSCISRHRHRSLEAIRQEILAAVDAFAGDEPLSDDVSLILLRREETTA